MGKRRSKNSLPILHGTVEFLALGALVRGGRMHGFEVLSWIGEASEGELLVEEGALYPALHRMEKRGWLTAVWATSEKGRRAKYYSLTRKGRAAFRKETQAWDRHMAAVRRVVVGEGTA